MPANSMNNMNNMNKTNNTKQQKMRTLTYEEASSELTTLKPDMQPAMKALLSSIKAFNDKYKIAAMYRIAMHINDPATSGFEISHVQLPKTLLNFLLTKYLQANDKVTRKPSALRLLAMLYKHQKFNVRYKRRLLLMLGEAGFAKPANENDASMVSTADNTTMAPEVSIANGDMPQDICQNTYLVMSASGKVLRRLRDLNSLEHALSKLGKKWSTVVNNGQIIRTNVS